MKNNIIAGLLLTMLALSGLPDTVKAEPQDFDRPPNKEQMERVRERVETLRIWKLTKALDLDEKTSAQLFPVLNRYDKKRAETHNAIRNDMRELRDSVREKREGRIRNVLERLENDHTALQRVNDEERAELKNILTIEQQANYLIFQHEFEHEIRKIIAESKIKRTERPFKERP